MADEQDDPIRGGPVNGEKRLPAQPDPESVPDEALDDDPYAHMTPNERFSQAIEKRDAMVRELQGTSPRQRRGTEKSPAR